jgi:hypothetical protein
MKKLMMVLTLASFASISAVQAGGEACCTSKTKATKKTSAKADCSTQVAGSNCSAEAKSACSAGAKQAKKQTPATARGAYFAQR